jgi:hypothetical protein
MKALTWLVIVFGVCAAIGVGMARYDTLCIVGATVGCE